MLTFKTGDIVKVPFPYTDRATRQHRPAIVITAGDLESQHGLLWVCMVTSAVHRSWPDDIAIDDLTLAGLPAASVVRAAKIATIDAKDATPLGRLNPAAMEAVRKNLQRILGDIVTTGH